MLNQTCGCGLIMGTDDDVTQADIETLESFKTFLASLLEEPVIEPMTGEKAPFPRYKYVVVDKDGSGYGTGKSYKYPVATVSRGTWNMVGDAARKGGCYYDHSHYILPGRTKGEAGGGSSPFIWSDVAYFEDAFAKDGIPIDYFFTMMYTPRNYVGRPHEILASTDQAIKCLQEKMAAQEKGEEVEEGRAAPASDYTQGILDRIPKWAWWTGGAVLLLGAGTATALVVRSRKGRAVGAWEYDWDDDEEEYLSPWEEQVEVFQQRHPQAAGCPAEYDMADALARQWRNEMLYCSNAEDLTRAIQAAWEGRCFHARKSIRKARCGRNPVARR